MAGSTAAAKDEAVDGEDGERDDEEHDRDVDDRQIPSVGHDLAEIGRSFEPNWKFLFGALTRDGETVIPRGDTVVRPGDLLALRSAGAYGFVMSSNYNSRPRAAEIMVDGDQACLVRERESIADLTRGERCLPD